MSEPTLQDPQRATLPDILMRSIELIIADEQTDPERAYVAAVLISFGWALWERQGPSFTPGSVQIPGEQWRLICGWLNEIRRGQSSEIDRVNYGLSWMNQGPSIFEGE